MGLSSKAIRFEGISSLTCNMISPPLESQSNQRTLDISFTKILITQYSLTVFGKM